ncbi:MAG: hypothetical protein LIP02_09855 [Bacteroidales bacterium]|nr:hypothetical protein [Bacteroidales bacterium]
MDTGLDTKNVILFDALTITDFSVTWSEYRKLEYGEWAQMKAIVNAISAIAASNPKNRYDSGKVLRTWLILPLKGTKESKDISDFFAQGNWSRSKDSDPSPPGHRIGRRQMAPNLT